MTLSSKIIYKLSIFLLEMVNTMAIRAKKLEVKEVIISPVSISMMQFQNFRDFFPAASGTYANIKQKLFSYSGINQNSTTNSFCSVTPMNTRSRAIKSISFIRDKRFSTSFTGSRFDRFARAFFRAKSLMHMSCITPESFTTAFT